MNHDPALELDNISLTSPIQMQNATETCPFKVVLAGTMGFALGGMFGLFMSSVRLPHNLSHNTHHF